MLANPEYPEEFSKDLQNLTKILSITRVILNKISLIQNKLIKFSPIFKFTTLEKHLHKFSVTYSSFLKLRELFMEIIKKIDKGKMSFFINLVSDIPYYQGIEAEEDELMQVNP
jgi:hypothetical protein